MVTPLRVYNPDSWYCSVNANSGSYVSNVGASSEYINVTLPADTNAVLVSLLSGDYSAAKAGMITGAPSMLSTEVVWSNVDIVPLQQIGSVQTPYNTSGSVVDDSGNLVSSTVTLITTDGKLINTYNVNGEFTASTPAVPYYAISDDANSVCILERLGTISDEPLNFVMDSTSTGQQYTADGFVYDADGNPLAQTVVVTATGEDPVVLGVGVSDGATGAYSVNVGSWSGEVMAYTHQKYGTLFADAENEITAGSVIHPTTPNQYVYKIITGGTLPASEPTEWPTEIRVFDLGTATAEPVKLLEPQMAGWFKTKAV